MATQNYQRIRFLFRSGDTLDVICKEGYINIEGGTLKGYTLEEVYPDTTIPDYISIPDVIAITSEKDSRTYDVPEV